MLPRKDWVTLKRFRTNDGKCNSSNLTKWGIIHYAKCGCWAQVQTMHYIVNEFPLTKCENGLEDLPIK